MTKSSQEKQWYRNFYRQPQFLSTNSISIDKYLFRQEFCNQNDNDNSRFTKEKYATRNSFILWIYRRWSGMNRTLHSEFLSTGSISIDILGTNQILIFFDKNIEYIIFDKEHAMKIWNDLVLWRRRTNAANTHSKSCFPDP